MRAFARFQVLHRFVFHFEPVQFHDPKVILPCSPDLTLLQLHSRNDTFNLGRSKADGSSRKDKGAVARALRNSQLSNRLVAVVFWLVGAFHGNAEVVGLFFAELGELHADFLEVEAGDFFVELLRQAIDVRFVGVFVLPEVELSESLVRE